MYRYHNSISGFCDPFYPRCRERYGYGYGPGLGYGPGYGPGYRYPGGGYGYGYGYPGLGYGYLDGGYRYYY